MKNTHIPKIYNFASAVIMLMMVVGCHQRPDRQVQAAEEGSEEFHADNDIAMTVRSIADAISMEEKLDSAQYDYTGVLTDGEGRPIYLDNQGNPGEWQVDVTTPTICVIRNIEPGDLQPYDLQDYLLTYIDLDVVEMPDPTDYDNDDETSAKLFDFGSGFIRFEYRNAPAPSGLDGVLMQIVVASH